MRVRLDLSLQPAIAQRPEIAQVRNLHSSSRGASSRRHGSDHRSRRSRAFKQRKWQKCQIQVDQVRVLGREECLRSRNRGGPFSGRVSILKALRIDSEFHSRRARNGSGSGNDGELRLRGLDIVLRASYRHCNDLELRGNDRRGQRYGLCELR